MRSLRDKSHRDRHSTPPREWPQHDPAARNRQDDGSVKERPLSRPPAMAASWRLAKWRSEALRPRLVAELARNNSWPAPQLSAAHLAPRTNASPREQRAVRVFRAAAQRHTFKRTTSSSAARRSGASAGYFRQIIPGQIRPAPRETRPHHVGPPGRRRNAAAEPVLAPNKPIGRSRVAACLAVQSIATIIRRPTDQCRRPWRDHPLGVVEQSISKVAKPASWRTLATN